MTRTSAPFPHRYDARNHLIVDHGEDMICFMSKRLGEERARELGLLYAAAGNTTVALKELVSIIEIQIKKGVIAPFQLEPELTGARAALKKVEGK